jgi:hypothetical protein
LQPRVELFARWALCLAQRDQPEAIGPRACRFAMQSDPVSRADFVLRSCVHAACSRRWKTQTATCFETARAWPRRPACAVRSGLGGRSDPTSSLRGYGSPRPSRRPTPAGRKCQPGRPGLPRVTAVGWPLGPIPAGLGPPMA